MPSGAEYFTNHTPFLSAKPHDQNSDEMQQCTKRQLESNTRYHGVELGQVSCGKQTFECGL